VADRPLILAAMMTLAFAISGYRFWLVLRPLFHAPGADRFDDIGERLKGVLTNVGLHRRLLNIRYSGVLHALIFSAFIVLFTAIIQAFGSGLFPGFSLAAIGGNTWIAGLQEVFTILILVGLGMALWQRLVIRPARFQGSNRGDALLIYLLVFGVVITMLMEFAFQIAAGENASAAWRPVTSTIAGALTALGISNEQAHTGQEIFYWAHVIVILSFLMYIPGSKHRHMFTAGPNIFMRSLEPKGRLPKADLDQPPVGIAAIDQFDWKHKLDMLSCTECGRCQAVCPAFAAGQPLSPKSLIMDLRDHMAETERGGSGGISLVGGVISEQTLWACTTCRACMEVCPIHIEHVPKIVEMRRTMVEDGRISAGLQDALGNLQQYGNSFGKPPRQRAKWTRELSFKIHDARKGAVDILWFVGDYASYDPRVQPITVKVAELFNAAGLDFGILFEAEQNSGNDVRRVGEEGLFDTLSQSNIDALAACEFNRIVTTDPHSLNALRQEYGAFGGDYEVLHYTQLLDELTDAGKLEIAKGQGGTVTYHDPCYLGRYNGGFDAPRSLIEKAGYKLHEMGRCRENSFCCGAGGGRIWQDEDGVVERPSENRIKEALGLGDAGIFVVACPKDSVMYGAAIENLAVQDRIKVCDIADLIEPAQPPTQRV
jgi:Fe-S oxidoreductase